MKIGVIFGGISTEHKVSIVSGTRVIKNLNKTKYQIYPLYIKEDGSWYHLLDNVLDIDIYKIGNVPTNIKKVDNVIDFLNEMDILFPVLHGIGGEDGSIEGLFTLLKKPYVGCGILSSALCMDKVYTKIILEKANILVTPSIYLKKSMNDITYIDESFNNTIVNIKDISNLIKEKFNYPVFIKPSNSGSSVGISKVNNEESLDKALTEAFIYDSKVLIEKLIVGHEVECAVLNNIASSVGEVLSAEDFYTFDAKYKNNESKTVIPANIDESLINKIKDISLKAFASVDGFGIARVDFFIEKDTNKIYLNEINTMPGFTEISMYPKLIESIGISYTELLDELINYSLKARN
ncbi:MAG: D-alanine--D-alanine ligase family protein [Bacilli bacterium]